MPSFPERARVPKLCHSILRGSFLIPEEHKPQPVGAQRSKPQTGWCRVASDCLSRNDTATLYAHRGLGLKVDYYEPSVHAIPASFTIFRICCHRPVVMGSSSCRSRQERRAFLPLDQGMKTVTPQECPAMSKQQGGLPPRVPYSHACA